MLNALLAIACTVLITTSAFRYLARQDRKRKNPARYYFLPWLLSVIGLSLVGFQILEDAIDYDDAIYAVILVAGFVWALIWVKSQMTHMRRR